jgi:hypothetical protein
MTCSFDYAVLRVVPRVEREEFVNAGVILFCPEQRFLGLHVSLNEARWKALWPNADTALIRARLEGMARVVSADARGGPISAASIREKFHWLVAPKSTIIQVSPVHTGISEVPAEALARVFAQMVGGEAGLLAVAPAAE